MKQKQQGNVLVWILIVLFVIIILVVGTIFLYKNIVAKQTADSTNSQENGVPQSNVNDIAPEIPRNQKTEIVTMQSDSSYQTYLVPSQNVDTFVKALPTGVRVISKKPLQ